MCGIGGVLNFNGMPCDADALDRLSEAMHERGPDDNGVYIDHGVGLVHRRLSIIDLSSAGRCPMPNESGMVQVVLNGEIYNFKELRKYLIDKGHVFRSSSDTEVIVHGYEEWGIDVVKRLDGMFALAVWDSTKKRLLLARDRVGEKPLYYVQSPESLVFASTLIALHSYFNGNLTIDPDGLECYLSHSFIPGPHTIWSEVKSFLPAHLALCDESGKFRMAPYWDFPDTTPVRLKIDEAEDYIETELNKSIRARLVADVPVGGFLSGGVDSSLILALASRQCRSIDTFSVGFKEVDFSELPFAKRVAETIGSRHHELMLDENDLLDSLVELIWQSGQPFADASIVPTHMVSRFARQHVKVCLSGDGGDESFAGYWRHESGAYAALYRRMLPETVRKSVLPRIFKMARHLGMASLVDRLSAMDQLSLSQAGAGYTNSQSWFNSLGEILGDIFTNRSSQHDPVACRTGRNWSGRHSTDLRQILYDDFQILLPHAYLTKVDVASMATSLEVRPPFLDHHFIEAAWSLPDRMKLKFGQPKFLLKRIAANYIPRELIYRPKMGFAMPLKHWWRGRLARVLRELMSDSSAVKLRLIKSEPVIRALDLHVAGKANNDTRLWIVLCLELWVRVVLEKNLPRSSSLSDVAL